MFKASSKKRMEVTRAVTNIMSRMSQMPIKMGDYEIKKQKGRKLKMRKFSIAKIASLIFVCVMLFAALTISVCAEEATDSTDVGDVFTFSGYSINEENGDACFGFTLNHAAKDALEIVDFGYIIVSYDKLNGQSPIDANGNAVELENGKAFVQSLKGYENTNYTFKLVNLSGEYSSRKYVITPYICDGTDVFYYNEKGEITNTVTGVSYEEMVELSPHEHTYEDGYCTVCELVDPDYYFPMTIPEALNAADGTNVQVSGTVVEINYPWSSDAGNMSVTIKDDEGNTLYIYKLATEVALCDVITVKGTKTTFNGTIEIAEGATANIDVKHECLDFTAATCKELAACVDCGKTKGELAAHNYIDGKCDVCGLVEGMSLTDTKYTFADYPAGTQYAENEEHVLDENVTVVTTQSHFTTQLRIYSSSTHNGYAIIKSANTITKIAVNAGNKVDVLVVYGSNDEGATWTEAAKISVTATTYGDYEAELAASYKWLKLDVEGEQQIRIKSMTLTAVSCTHVHQTTTKTESTCTENGYEVVTCNACNAEISRVELALADHNYVGVVTEPTCTAAGYTTYTCSACEASYEEAGEAALGHSYDANNMCERCGSEKHVCEYTSEVTKEPTCTEKGERTYTCTSCANSYTEEIEALGHTEAEIPAVAPTCTVAGATTGVKCSVCETVITAPEAIDALGHSYTDGVCANGCGIDDPTYYFPMTITEALEQADGKNVKLVVTVISIDTPYSETYGNITVTIEDISGGTLMLYRLKGNYAVGDVITVSGTMDTYNGARQTAAGATAEAHVCSDFTEATCEVLATCKDCGATTGELAEHTFGDDGVCSVCGQLNHVHDYTYNSVVTAPTCTEVGYTTNYCECGATEKVDEVAATGHNYTDGVCANGCGIDDPDYYYPMSIADALTAPVGKKVVLTGVISSVAPWSAQYGNMEAYLSDGNGNEILLYRIVTEVGVGDKVSVQGEIGVYNNVNQIAQNGSTVTITEKHTCTEYTDATCKELAACVVCGAETGDFAAHNYVNGVCSVCSHEEGTAEVVTITASKTVADLITEYGWTSSTTKQTFMLDEKVTVQINGGSNTGKAYNGDHIRIYATDSPAGTVTISVPEGYELVSIKISTITGTYAFLYVDGTTTDISNQTVDVSGSSVVLESVKNGTNGKQVRITAIEVVYKEA